MMVLWKQSHDEPRERRDAITCLHLLMEAEYLSDRQSGGGELREQTAEDGGMEVHQQPPLPAERERGGLTRLFGGCCFSRHIAMTCG